jgi:hypothetical protein
MDGDEETDERRVQSKWMSPMRKQKKEEYSPNG